MSRVPWILPATALLLSAPPATAAEGEVPQVAQHPAARRATVDEHPGRPLPLDARFLDQNGREVRLGRYFRGGRPVILVPGYHRCETLCPVVLDALERSLSGGEEWRVGRDLAVVSVSLDPREGPEDAGARAARRDLGSGWHFLAGDPGAVERVMEAVGFRYGHDPRTDQFAHVAVIVAATPDGRVGRYLYGVDLSPDEVGAALAAARSGRAAASLERVLIQCFRFLPVLQRHAGEIAWFLRLGGLAIVAALGAVFLVAGRRAVREGAS